jgi:hypothetical protein
MQDRLYRENSSVVIAVINQSTIRGLRQPADGKVAYKRASNYRNGSDCNWLGSYIDWLIGG